jgi:hypothetical protein
MNRPPDQRWTVVLHLHHEATIHFDASQLWPLTGAYGRFGTDLDALAAEVARRMHEDGYVGYRPTPETIALLPLNAISRLDFESTVVTETQPTEGEADVR